MNLSLNVDGAPVIVGVVAERKFSTGSRGYQVTGKAVINGENCQINILATVIGSKPDEANHERKA